MIQPQSPLRAGAPLIALLCTLLLCSGCSRLLVAVDSNAINDPPGKRTMAQQLADESIELKAVVNMHAADSNFKGSHIVAVSYNGYVLLAGQVANEALKKKAADVVRDIRHVRRIYNELEVSAPTASLVRTSDTWITAKIKSSLLAGSDTPGLRTKVVTENGVVYLMGMVTREEGERLARAAADISGVQRVVRLFEIIGA
ncbi:BON domain-containing protein [Chromatocurvus halotolerans]|uniref:Osmotically-inducible protein OsmY n=1 Tax=Chromatocurvus halotolerans TaxID=1132028 RepID=A0A4V2SBN1_9GAMM|nr:BON domain-containing protein [Chromatocurvus halotolerans]TCO76210.1 osmotically-inducible protein OsmY [Chromatocurvus halotolerans]